MSKDKKVKVTNIEPYIDANVDKSIEQLNKVKTPIYYLIFNPQAGVWLGGGDWSYVNPGSKASAPVMTLDEVEKVKKLLMYEEPKAFQESVFIQDMRMCSPDREGHRASQDAVANAGLPRW